MDLKNIDWNKITMDEENRFNYTVSTHMKKVWAVQLDLLIELLDICKKHQIKVFAFAGTLLGAVRHRGFIPWDDDLDVCMLREDFEKLLQVADEFKNPYFLQTALTDKQFFCGYARLRNSNTTGIIVNQLSKEYNNGIYIDIFVMDGLIENPMQKNIQLLKKYFVSTAIYNYYRKYNKSGFFLRFYNFNQKILRTVVKYETLIDMYNKIISKYNVKADKVTILTHNSYFQDRYWCKKEDLEECEYMRFEYIDVPIPKNYDEVLTNMYGNYMELPPVEKRGEWHKGTLIYEPDIPYLDYIESINDNTL